MKMKRTFLFITLMMTVSLSVMAQTESKHYVNVKFGDGTVRSFEATPNMKVTFGEKEEIGTINGHAYVELAGYKWATENVANFEKGLTTFAIDRTYGLYYTQSDDNAKNAAESWGGTWTLPTEEQWEALMDENNCTWTWKTDYTFKGKTMNGYIVSDKNDDTKFIFLPAAGICFDGYDDVLDQGGGGDYWSSVSARYLLFYNGYRYMSRDYPGNGMSVRPVSY